MKPAHVGARSVAGKAAPGDRHDKTMPHMQGARGRATPESKAQSVLTQELRRQRNMVSRMADTDREVALVLEVLRELTCDPAFVALMNTRGFTTLPRLLHERLTGRPR
ncbi:hypothetical protein [Paraburkholderia graminis]|uniref:hypothetical protein n=1 Tax=Paraburkholderia graminis TaxID=60548 RepID=UPI0038BCC35A